MCREFDWPCLAWPVFASTHWSGCHIDQPPVGRSALQRPGQHRFVRKRKGVSLIQDGQIKTVGEPQELVSGANGQQGGGRLPFFPSIEQGKLQTGKGFLHSPAQIRGYLAPGNGQQHALPSTKDLPEQGKDYLCLSGPADRPD